MTNFRAVLLDADGVAISEPALFSKIYAERYGIDESSLESFFQGDFKLAMTGQAELADLIRKHQDVWRWDRDPHALIDMWVATENNINEELMPIVDTLMNDGTPVYLATNQEANRTNYLREEMFPGKFSDILASNEIGHLKNDSKFWEAVLNRLSSNLAGLEPKDLVYFDDSESNVAAAEAFGINAYFFESPDQVRQIIGL